MTDGSRKIFQKFTHCLPPSEYTVNSIICRNEALFLELLNRKHMGRKQESGYVKSLPLSFINKMGSFAEAI